MTALYAASREALADGMCGMDGSPCFEHILQANRLIDSGVVRVIDCPHKRCPCACHLEDVP